MILILFAFFIRTSWFQTYLAQEIAGYLSDELQIEIRIDKVDIIFFDKVDIDGIYVEDKIKDTLFFSESIRINIGGFSIRKAFVEIQNVELNKSTVNIIKYKNDSTFNYQHLVDYFASAEEDTTENEPFRVSVAEVSLNDLNFKFQDQNQPPISFGINYTDLNIQHLTGTFSGFNFEDNTITAQIEDLKFKEQSGLYLKKFNTQLSYSPTEISLTDFELMLSHSILRLDFLSLATPNGSADFSDFVNKVVFEGNIKNSIVDLTDIAYFVPAIQGMNTKINLNNIDISGPVYGMHLNNTDISLLESTILKGNFQIPNMDELSTTEFDEEFTLFQTTTEDIERIKLTPFLGGEDYIKLPTKMVALDKIKYQNGAFKGALTDFQINGNFTSGLGDIYAKNGLHFKMDTLTQIYSYSTIHENEGGRDIIINELNLGAISGYSILGKTTGFLSIKEGSKGFNSDDLLLLLTGRFQTLTLNNYTYHNIIINQGEFSNNLFDGQIDIEDDNLALTYDGWVDLENDMSFAFEVHIDSAKLAKLNFREGEIVDRLQSSKIIVKISGNSLDNVRGSVTINGVDYQDSSIGANIQLDSLSLVINRSDSVDQIILTSDYIDIDLSGKFDLSDVWPVIQHQLARVANNLVTDVDISKSNNKYFDLSINLKDVNPFISYLDSNLFIAKGTTIKSNYNLEELKLNIMVNSDLIKYGDMKFYDVYLKNNFDSVSANIQYEAGEAYLHDSLGVSYAAIFSYVKDNKFSTNVGWGVMGDVEPALFAFETSIDETNNILTEFKPSFFFLKSQKWDVSLTSKILLSQEIVDFTDFRVTNKKHFIEVSGRVSEDPSDWLYFQVHDFNLADINGMIEEDIDLGGVLNIEGGVADVYNNIRFMALSEIAKLKVKGEKVGDLLIDNKWNKDNNSVEMNGNLKREGKETFKFEGVYYADLDKDNLDVVLNFDNTDIAFLNAFEDPEMYKEIEGILNGKLTIKGELVDPQIRGHLNVENVKVFAPMFNVTYGMAGGIDFVKDGFTASNFNIFDQEGNRAVTSMKINHVNWGDWKYDIHLDISSKAASKRFLAMNTIYKDGDFYYGKAYVSGDVYIAGTPELTEINVDASTRPGTDLKLAMYGSGNLEESSFIVFDSTVPPRYPKDGDGNGIQLESTGVIMNLNFRISKETKTTIVFDPIYEDQIEVDAGEGNISLNMDEYGDMKMFGNYTIQKGMYYMRVKGLVNKEFKIRNGSSLIWNISPYDADIDIQADYNTNVSFAPILPAAIGGSADDKESVTATINMGSTLMNPSISFEITSSTAGSLGQAALNSIAADQDELNKQFFSVVALNKFIATNGQSGASGSAMIDIAQDQINAILDNIGENYDIAAALENNSTALDFETKVGEKISIITSVGVYSGDDQSSGGIIGDVIMEYRLNDDGTFTVNVFNTSNQGSDAENGPFTQGVGLHYEENFNTVSEFKLLQAFLNIFRSKDKDVELNSKKNSGKKRPVEGGRDAVLNEDENESK